MTIDPEKLAAYADGELDAAETAAVEAAIAANPALAEEVAAHRALRAKLSAHFAPILDMPVPGRLTAALKEPRDNVIDFGAALQAFAERAERPRRRWIMVGTLAASLALGLVIGTQMPRGEGGSIGSEGGQVVASGALEKALTTQLASAQEGGDVRILISFKARDGRYCRSFQDPGTAGIACHNGTGWAIERLQSRRVQGTAQGDYRQAGSADRDIMEASQNMALDGALDAESEKKARDAGWRL